MFSFWYNIPLHLDPIAFSIGFFTMYWYALFFLLAFFATWRFCAYIIKKEGAWLKKEEIFDLAVILFLGALLGGHLGFAFFYEPQYFLTHPLSLFFPYDVEQEKWTGISGMSFHGGLIGTVLALTWFATSRKKDFWQLADVVSLSVPLGLFFGRIGNFLNGELYGRLTEKPWGMFFFDGVGITFRHPSALYEAALEGWVLFFLLYFLRRYITFPGRLSIAFLISYACIRFLLEFFREPDAEVSLFLSVLTRGQMLSVAMFLLGFILLLWLKKCDHGKNSFESVELLLFCIKNFKKKL